MNTLTPSQQQAIETKKRIFSKLYPSAEYWVWQPHKQLAVVLIAHYDAPNMAGTITRFKQSWDIGKRGKVTPR